MLMPNSIRDGVNKVSTLLATGYCYEKRHRQPAVRQRAHGVRRTPREIASPRMNAITGLFGAGADLS